MIWDWAYTLEILPRLAHAAVITVEATVLGFVFAAILGLVLAIVRLAFPRTQIPISVFVEFIRSTPLLIQIFFLYFVFPNFGIVLDAFTAGVLALGLHYGAYCSEVYRAGFEGVHRGQWEAATALNLGIWTTFRDIIYAPVYGGGIRSDRALKCFIPGGASAPWFYEEHLDLPLEKATVDKAGSMLGSGAIVVMDDTTDAVAACLSVVKFFSHESCGKCTPCREGTNWLEKILRRILDGYGRPSDLDLLMDVADNISPGIAWPPKQTTICPLGPSAVSPLASALGRFRPEFEAHIARAARAEAASAPAQAVGLPGGVA